MLAKISLTAAFVLLVAPPITCASNRNEANPAPITRQSPDSQTGLVVAQDGQSSVGSTDNGNDSDNDSDASDSDSNDSDDNQNGDGNQNADGNQMNEQNAAGDDQPMPPTAVNGGDNDQNDSVPQFNQPPQQQPVNPYQ